MPAPFAALESRLNDQIVGRLANATALVGASPVPVIFDQPYADAFDDQIDAAEPQCVGKTAELGALARDDEIVIDGVAYRVRRAEPDGSGLTRLALYAPLAEALP